MVAGHIKAVTGLILAGGQARRMSGEDKGLVDLAGRPMVERVIEALRPQVGSLLLSANRNLDRYAAYGYPVVADELDGFQGPLAGVLSALRSVATEFMVAVPCDAPCLPPDLVQRLHASCLADTADAAVVHDGRRLRGRRDGRLVAGCRGRAEQRESGEQGVQQSGGHVRRSLGCTDGRRRNAGSQCVSARVRPSR